ncbi:MAG: HEAT repeat domain-containing protein, partial [Candidatus Udaeobacter sp.]
GFRYPGGPHLGDVTTEQLVAALESPHGWWRDTAHRLLFERHDSTAIAPLRQMLTGSHMPQARLGALWSLAGFGAVTNDDLNKALDDQHEAIREHAIRLAEERLDQSPELLDKVIAQSNDSRPRIRFQAAFSLGESRDPRAARALANLARSSSSDPWIRTAILSSASSLTIDLLKDLLSDDKFAPSAGGQEFINQLAFIVGARNQISAVHQLLDQLAMYQPLSKLSAQHLLLALGRGVKQSGARLESRTDMPKPAAQFLNDSFNKARDIARDQSDNIDQRRQAIELLGLATLKESRETLTELLDARQPVAVQIAAARALADYADVDVGKVLVDRFPQYAPEVREAVTTALLGRADRTKLLLDSTLAGKISLTHLSTTQRSFLLTHPIPTIQALAKRVFANLNDSRERVIATYTPISGVNTDIGRGEAIFHRECMVCHKLGSIGHAIGPDLTATSFRDREALLVQVLDPNRNVPPQFVSYVCIDNDGRVITGILTAQTATSITLSRQENESTTVLRTNIDNLVSTGKSLMPEGFERTINKQEMADLIAFLQRSQRPTAPEPLDIGTLPGMVEPKD